MAVTPLQRGDPMTAVWSHSMQCGSHARATEPRPAGRPTASGARLKPNVGRRQRHRVKPRSYFCNGDPMTDRAVLTTPQIYARIQPSIKLNGNVVGESKPGGFFYVDVRPGDYEVVLSTEVDKKLTFKLERQQQRCVRMSVGLGVVVYRVYPELVDPAVCDSEIQTSSYTGSTTK
jgi:hypothetical protein